MNKLKMVNTTRTFQAFVGASVLGLSACGLVKEQQEQVELPNIIYLLADDLGYGDLSCYGQQHFETPNIDRIAANGIRFTRHYAGSTVSAPSRSVLLTGKHTGNTRLRGNFCKLTRERVPLKPEDVTLAELMKEAGYVTGATGKWGLGEIGTTGVPTSKGFDEWLGFISQGRAHFYYPPFIFKNTDTLFIPENKDGNRGRYVHDMFTEFALDFVNTHRDTSFFLYVPFTIPHAEMLVPEEDLLLFKGKFPEDGHGGLPRHYGEQPYINAAYAAMITRMDRHIGELLDLLEELGIHENTIVMFTSDNGPAAFLNGFLDSSSGLRGRKRDLYEGGIRVPFVVQWPGRIQQSVFTDHISAFEDVMPTLAEIAGVPVPDDIDGISFLPTLLGNSGNSGKQVQHDYLYWEFHERGTSQAILFDEWKAIWHHHSDEFELYNLAEDETEQHNLAGSRPDMIERAKEIFLSARSESQHWPL